MKLSVSHEFLPKRNSTRASIVMDHFGVGFEQGPRVIAEGLELPIRPGDVVLFAGPSGSGKSSLLRTAAEELRRHVQERDDPVVDVARMDLGERTLVDALALPAEESLGLLSACGLGEAQVLLRTPSELSAGELYRFRLAWGAAQRGEWVLADEFTSVLDRTLARVVAYNVRRLASQTGRGFLLATAQEDVIADLAPDILVHCRLDGEPTIEVRRAPGGPAEKKSAPSRSRTNSGSARGPSPTGRISLGGIIDAAVSARCGGSRCCGTKTGRSASAYSPRRPCRWRRETDTSGSPAAGPGRPCRR